MMYDLTEIEEIDGSPPVSQTPEGVVTTADGREWVWHDQSYSVEPGCPTIPDGEWIPYKPTPED